MASMHERKHELEADHDDDDQPVSPTAQYFNTCALSVCIIAVLELETPVDNSQTFTLLNNLFLPINPRFSSIMITDENGVKQWRKVDVKLEDHVNVPTFPAGLSPECYDAYFQDYLSEIANGQLPQSRPLWEIHKITYPTSSAAETVVFKLHHSLGDGYSLMGALFSCLQRIDNPSLPLTLPSLGLKSKSNNLKKVPNMLSVLFNTVSDITWSLLKSNVIEDDRTPIRSGTEGVEFLPLVISTVTFSLEHIKQIKTKLGVTVNDVITGILFYGTRMYMESAEKDSGKASSNGLVLFNTRAMKSYQTCEEMLRTDSTSMWGNQFAFLHVPITKSSSSSIDHVDPLQFIYDARKIIKKRRSSLGFYVTGKLIEMIRKFRGPEVAGGYIHGTLRNSSLTVSNLIGPIEKIALANHPCRGIYFMVAGSPQSITITVMSYMGKLRVAVGVEKGFINHHLFISCLEKAFERTYKAAVGNFHFSVN